MRARLLTAALALLVQQAVPADRAGDIRDVHFESAALAREVPYRVLLPAGYDASPSRRYPVLYLLHGLDGRYTDWTTRTAIAHHSAPTPAIIVMPDGANSWFVNWHAGDRERWEDYLVRDLIADVDARFRTDARREARAIAGLSMGGYGAIRMGLKHPSLFSLSASLSGAFDITRLDTFGWTEGLRAEFARAFGPIGSARRRADDVHEIARTTDTGGLPFFYVACGTADGFLPANRELVAILQARQIRYEYRETPGAHSWTYWDREIQHILRLLPTP